ncbi:MAG: DUF2786 domain-containing protein [Actinobacteria bacterium]|nr:DUF2786 domain-containing protein [Actinomycetota bacterium]
MSPPPGSADTWTNRIQALLTKAESTSFPEEAEALIAKAQELMARHAVDEAMLAERGQRQRAEICTDVVLVEAPYATPKSSLLAAVARANNCRTVRGPAANGAQRCIVLGNEADVDNVLTLFAALSLHAVRAMLDAPVPAHDTPRRFRHAFLLAFSGRIGERLRAASVAAQHEAEREAGAAGVAVVLASRADAVDRAFRQEFPNVRTTTVSSSSLAGRLSGRRAADRAGLGQGALGGRGRSLPAG